MRVVWIVMYEVNKDLYYDVYLTRARARRERDIMKARFSEDETFIRIIRSWMYS